MIWNISPMYFSDNDLTDEYRKLNTLLMEDAESKNFSKFYLDNRDQLYYRLSSISAELMLREIKHPKINASFKLSTLNSPKYDISPYEQLMILANKYSFKTQGRASLPKNAQELWAQHKYSVMARDVNLYRNIGRSLAGDKSEERYKELAKILCDELCKKPKEGSILNALQHMWGYVSNFSSIKKTEVKNLSLIELLYEIASLVKQSNQKYLLSQTALSELEIWIEK